MSADPVLKIFVHTSGNFIAAQEIEQKDGTSIKVRYPAFARQNTNGVGYSFEPFQFVVDEFKLYTGAFMGETEMPPLMKPFYVKYMEGREEENRNMP